MEWKKYSRGKWQWDEDELLKYALHKHNSHCWRKISEEVKTRSPIQCMHRWSKILKPGKIKAKWTIEEDISLTKYIKIYSDKNWTEISRRVPGRTSKQCRERWVNVLQPGVKKGEWTPSDDKKIFKLYIEYGARWTEIAAQINGRTENSIKNRFYSTLRRFANKDKQDGLLNEPNEHFKKDKLLTYVNRALVEDTNFRCKKGRRPLRYIPPSLLFPFKKCKSTSDLYKNISPRIKKCQSCMKLNSVYQETVRKVFLIRKVVRKPKEGNVCSFVQTNRSMSIPYLNYAMTPKFMYPAIPFVSKQDSVMFEAIKKNNELLQSFYRMKSSSGMPYNEVITDFQSQLLGIENMLSSVNAYYK